MSKIEILAYKHEEHDVDSFNGDIICSVTFRKSAGISLGLEISAEL